MKKVDKVNELGKSLAERWPKFEATAHRIRPTVRTDVRNDLVSDSIKFLLLEAFERKGIKFEFYENKHAPSKVSDRILGTSKPMKDVPIIPKPHPVTGEVADLTPCEGCGAKQGHMPACKLIHREVTKAIIKEAKKNALTGREEVEELIEPDEPEETKAPVKAEDLVEQRVKEASKKEVSEKEASKWN